MEKADRQKQLRSCRIDIPYCISFYERYRLDPAYFFEMPLEPLSLSEQIRKKCFDADIGTLDKLLRLSPNQLVLESGFCLETLLEVEKCLANFVSAWTASQKTKIGAETKKRDSEDHFAQKSDEVPSSQMCMQEAQEQTYAQMYSITPSNYHSENISAQFLSQYTKKFLIQNRIYSVESLLHKTPSELAGMDGVSNTNIQNIERFLGWLRDYSAAPAIERQPEPKLRETPPADAKRPPFLSWISQNTSAVILDDLLSS